VFPRCVSQPIEFINRSHEIYQLLDSHRAVISDYFPVFGNCNARYLSLSRQCYRKSIVCPLSSFICTKKKNHNTCTIVVVVVVVVIIIIIIINLGTWFNIFIFIRKNTYITMSTFNRLDICPVNAVRSAFSAINQSISLLHTRQHNRIQQA